MAYELDPIVSRCLEPIWTKDTVLQDGMKFLDQKVADIVTELMSPPSKIKDSSVSELTNAISHWQATVQSSRNEIQQLAKSILKITEKESLTSEERNQLDKVKSRLKEVSILFEKNRKYFEALKTSEEIDPFTFTVTIVLPLSFFSLCLMKGYINPTVLIMCGSIVMSLIAQNEEQKKQTLKTLNNDYFTNLGKNAEIIQTPEVKQKLEATLLLDSRKTAAA